MAMHTGVTSARAVCKPCSSPSLSRSSSTNKLVRRRGRGSLVRSRAFIWSKEDLQKLHELAKRPRHEIIPDVVDHISMSSQPSQPPSSDSSTSTDLDDTHNHHHTTFAGAVDQQPTQLNTPPSQNEPPFRSVNQSTSPWKQFPNPFAATTSKPPLQRLHPSTHSLSEPQQNVQLPAHSHHTAMSGPSATNPPNLAVVSGIAARLIDLAL